MFRFPCNKIYLQRARFELILKFLPSILQKTIQPENFVAVWLLTFSLNIPLKKHMFS